MITPVHGLDFTVYREGASVLFAADGERSLYDPVPHDVGTRGLPFTYPPFAALVFLPFAYLPIPLGLGLLTATSILCLLGTAVVAVDYLARSGVLGRGAAGHGAALVLATVLIGFSAPWRDSLDFGQVNAMIMALVVADLMRPAGRIPRGILIGIAAGIKLTPLAFGLIFLARRDWRAILATGAGFAGTAALGWTVAAEESRTFWSGLLGASERVGDPSIMYNMSLNSLTMHLGLEGADQRAAWALACLAVIGVGYLAIRAADGRGDTVAAIAANGIVMVAISPVSWFHHWVWAALIIPVAWVAARRCHGARRFRVGLLAAALYPAFLLSSFALTILLTGEIRGHGPVAWELLSSLGLLLSLIVLGVLAFGERGTSPAAAGLEPVDRQAAPSGSVRR
ncbi:hypothetical protein GCM10008096_03820 [Zhihengliuella salsuginis]|uniref:Alpha-1,2-mannosyltransferase n=2 Tax=Zhihengliuella salsuginis TaxID=578222 RepID=A0ABQ3GCK5_9MICC|nr:hypothetical protein GCM10008096_03820 [Zhihengliuella salsuginis]